MRNWIDNIPAMSGPQDYQASHHDMVEAAQGAVAVSSEIKTSPLSRDFMVWSVGQTTSGAKAVVIEGHDGYPDAVARSDAIASWRAMERAVKAVGLRSSARSLRNRMSEVRRG